MTQCKFCEVELKENENVCPSCGKEQEIYVFEDNQQIELEAQREALRKEYTRNSVLRYFSYFFLLLGMVILFRLEDKIWIAGISILVGLVLNRMVRQGLSQSKEKQEAIDRILLNKKD